MALVNTETGEPARWEHLRGIVLYRDEYRCQICGLASATEVDHIWPKAEGGPDRLDNLQAACRPCNREKGDTVDLRSATLEQVTWARDVRQAKYQQAQSEIGIYDELAAMMAEDPSLLTVGDALKSWNGAA